MPDPECEPKSPTGDLHMGSQSSPPVPQITLTEANDTHSRSSTKTPQPSLSGHSPLSLSPTLGRSSAGSTSPAPLPLTRDLLQRKNKLDALLRDGSERMRQHQYPASPAHQPIMTFGTDSNIIVDERVTAGLGITTPTPGSTTISQPQDVAPLHSSGTRHRRHGTRPSISTSMAAIMDSEKRPSNHKSPPASPQINEFYSWIYDRNLKPAGHSTSIKDHMMMFSGLSSRGTSRSASSIHQSIYDEKKTAYAFDEKHPDINQHLTPPPPYSQHSSPISHASDVIHPRYGHKLLGHFFQAAARVVNLRGPEQVDDSLPQANSITPSASRRYQLSPRSPHHNQDDYDTTSAHHFHPEPYHPSITSSPFDKRSIVSSPALSLVDNSSLAGAGRLDKRSLYSDYPSTTKEESRYMSASLNKHAVADMPPNIPPSPLGGHSLCMFAPDNPIRRYLWNNIIRSWFAESFLFIVILLHYFLLVCDPIYENQQKTVFGAQWTHYAIFGIQVVYTLEAICKSIVYGIWLPPTVSTGRCFWFRRWFASVIPKQGTEAPNLSEEEAQQSTTKAPSLTHRPYISGFANALDIVSIVSYWIDFGLMIHGYPYCSLFKAIGASRPLRLAMVFNGTATILRSLLVSWDMLKDVMGFIFFFLVLFAMIGLITFRGVFSRRCYAVGPDGGHTLVDPPLHCSGYYSGSTIRGAYNPDTDTYSYPGYHGYICRNDQICLEIQDNNPNFGFANFDTIYFALLAVFSSMSLELWTELMAQNMDADSKVAALFYCLVAYVLSFILIFMIFAVITSGFSRVRAAHRVSAFTGKKKTHRVLHSVQGEEEFIWRFEDPNAYDQGRTRRYKQLLIRLVKSRTFFYFGVLLVALDIGFMCARSAHASGYVLEMIDNAETAFTFLFAFEIFIRIMGALSWTQFWYSGRNKFDLFLVIVTCVIQLPMIQDSQAYKYLTIFQCLRAYRLFIGIPRVRRLLSAALGNGEGVIYVVIFLLLLTALFSPIFMQLFGGDFGFADETDLRCDTFWQSFLTLMMLYTSETWTDFLYNAMESQPHFSAVYAAIITCGYFAFARYVMSGLYIAVILENFELEDDVIKQYQIRQFIQRRAHTGVHRVQGILDKLFGSLYLKSSKKQVNIRRLPTGLTASMDRKALTEMLVVGHTDSISDSETTKPAAESKRRSKGLLEKFFDRWRKEAPSAPHESPGRQDRSDMYIPSDLHDFPDDDYELIVEEENRQATAAEVPTSKSLFIFSSNNRVRRWCKVLAGSSVDGRAERKNIFNWFIMACVLASILLVILDEPSTRLLRQDTIRQSAYRVADMTLSIVFVVEIVVRIIADGLILLPGAYLRNPWNRLDFTVVVLNLVALFAGDGDLSRALGTVRSLRVLRLIRYFSSMRDVFVDLFHAFPLMLDALLLVFLVMVFFSIYGVNMLGGRMTACNDEDVGGRSSCIGEFLNNVGEDNEINILQPRVWAIPEEGMYSYDDFPIALAHLFSLSSTEGWIDSLFYAMSAPPEPDIQPSFDWDSPSVYHSIFYVVFMVISHGTLQLFVGVIIEKFKQRAGITTMTTGQRQYADLRRQLAEIKPTPKAQAPDNKVGGWCHYLVANKHGIFNKFMMSVVILNVCVIATEFQNQPEWLTKTQDYCYLIFIILYIFETIIKGVGLGWKKWSKGKWNWYCALIATSALILTILRFALPDLWTLRLERYCLVLAAFRLGEGIDSLQTLYHTIRISLPKIIRVTAVFLLVLCLFAMIFMELFGLTKYGQETNEHNNFRDYGNALLLLIRVATGEAWNIVMMDSTVQAPNCVASDDYLLTDCGSPAWAFVLYNTYYLVCTHIFLNLFTAAVLSNFEYAYETRSRFTLLSKDDLRSFKSAWSELDPTGSGYIQKPDVIKFLRLLDGRFRMRIYDDKHSIHNLQKLSQQGMRGSIIVQEKPIGFSSTSNVALPIPFNVDVVNKSLQKIDTLSLQRRRRAFNLCYLEIIGAETTRGISFEDVRTIMSYRFVDIEEALPIDALIERLEKHDQVRKAYAAERARGVFLTLLQRKRYLHALWQKKNDEEMRKLGISNKSPLQLDTSAAGLSPKSPYSGTGQWKNNRSPVPTIVIEDAPPSPRPTSDYVPSPASLTIPLSPMTNYSFETQYGSPIGPGGGADSLNVNIGTVSPQYSPPPLTDQEENISLPGALSPNSPYSPTTMRRNWRIIDGNASMSPELAESLMESLKKNAWADMLHGDH